MKKANIACLVSCGRALLNDSNNVEWNLKVESGAELQLKLIYTVEHPVQDTVEGLLAEQFVFCCSHTVLSDIICAVCFLCYDNYYSTVVLIMLFNMIISRDINHTLRIKSETV